MNFVTKVIENGGNITPLLIPPALTNGTGLFNPSVFVDDVGGKSTPIVNLRHCQYTIYHSERGHFEHEFGPLVYLHPENDLTLTTTNYILKMDGDTVQTYGKVDTNKLDVEPLWEFVGLEDARLVRWDGRLYMAGVRRDTTPNGVGRMELSQVEERNGQFFEVSRMRIPAPGKNDSYCEKNWMPITDKPYTFVKWTNPTEIVHVTASGECNTIFLGERYNDIDYRGGSQVIPFGNYRICLVHTVNLYTSEAGRKNARYRHAFVVWDKDWNIVKITDEFSFLDGEIEFACGMAECDNDLLISFGFQDNAAFLLKCPKKFIMKEVLGL